MRFERVVLIRTRDLAALFDHGQEERLGRASAVAGAIDVLRSLPAPTPQIGDDIGLWFAPRAKWIGPPRPRDSVEWRPFACALLARSTAYALVGTWRAVSLADRAALCTG